MRKTAMVTGAARGIGAAIALQLARDGMNIVINYNGSAEKAEEVKKACEEYGVEAIAVKANVSVAEEVDAMVKRAMDTFGRVDVLINNAGITKDGLMLRMSEADFDDVLGINLKGTFLCCKAVTKIMMKQRYGKIVNLSSVVGIAGNPGQVNYSASKAGVIGMTKSLAKEMASRNICVNAIAPGFIQTDMTKALDENQMAQITRNIPSGKLGTPEDIAKLASFLAGDDAAYITGQVIRVDGGMSI